jgi:hypothetical protein
LDYGFSLSTPSKISETFKQPLKNSPTILAIFVSNPKHVDKLVSAKLIDHDNNDKSAPIPLKQIRDDLFVTELINFPDGKFKIVVDGLNDENQKLIWVSPLTFQAIDTSKL